MKKCSCCETFKEEGLFWNNKSTKDGKANYCKECGKQFDRNKYSKFKEIIKLKRKEYRQTERYKILNKIRINLPKYIQKRNENRKRRIKNDINFKLSCNLRSRIWDAMKGKAKSKKTLSLLGCSIEEFQKYLESKFNLNMTWDNYGLGINKWNIDHIIPCAAFDLTKPEEQYKCFHYTNMQPMWSIENSKKNSIINNKKRFYI